MPVPHFYAYYSADDKYMGIQITEPNEHCVAIYSIAIYDIPKINELGWNILANTDYQIDDGDTEIDISSLFDPSTPIGKVISHDLTVGVSPSKFLDVKLIRDDDIEKYLDFEPDWNNKVLKLKSVGVEEVVHIVIYADKIYINEINAEMAKYNENRLSSAQHNSN